MKSSFGVKGLSEQLAYLGSQGVAGGALQDQSQHFGFVVTWSLTATPTLRHNAATGKT